MGEQKTTSVQQLMQRATEVARRKINVGGAAWGPPISKWKIPKLLYEIKYSGNKRRIPVIVELGRRGGEEAVETLTKLILSDDYSNTIKSCAILALGRIAAEALEKDLKEEGLLTTETMSLIGNMNYTFKIVMEPRKLTFRERLESCDIRDPVAGSVRVVNERIDKILKKEKG